MQTVFQNNYQIFDNFGNLICPNPIELTLEDISKFTIIDNNCEQIYKSSKKDSGCGEYLLIHVIDPQFNSNNCIEITPKTPICERVLTFNQNPTKTRVSTYTEFEVYVSGNEDDLVYFKTDITEWLPANIGKNGIKIRTNSTGQCESIYCKLEGCDEVWGCFTSFNPLPCSDSYWDVTSNYKCEDNILHLEYISNCGTTEFRPTNIPCGCVEETWTPTNEFTCLNNLKVYKEVSNCGTFRYMAPSNQACNSGNQRNDYWNLKICSTQENANYQLDDLNLTAGTIVRGVNNICYELVNQGFLVGPLLNTIGYIESTDCSSCLADNSEIEFADWNILTDAILVIKQTGSHKFLLQTNSLRTYYFPRGLNMLNELPTEISYRPGVTINLSELSNDQVTETNGLDPSSDHEKTTPAIWDFQWWADNNYVQNAVGEWVLANSECVDSSWTTIQEECQSGISVLKQVSNCGIIRYTPGGQACLGINDTIPSVTETSNNTYNFSNHFNTYDYSKFDAVAGFQFPVFRGQSGLLEPFKAGWNYLDFANYYPVSSSLGTSSHAKFSMFQWDSPTFGPGMGNIYAAANGMTHTNLKNKILNRDFSNIINESDEAWNDFASHLISYAASYNSLVNNEYSYAGLVLLDDEKYVGTTGTNFDQVSFIAKTCIYLNKVLPGSKIVHYGYPANTIHWNTDLLYKNSAPNVGLNEFPMGQQNVTSHYWFDGTSSYTKSPLPISESLYQKTGNQYVLNSQGKRKLRTDVFSEYLFGVKNTWHPKMYNPFANNYTPFYEGNNQVNPGIINPYTGVEVTDIEYATAYPYKLVANIKATMSNINNIENGILDPNVFNPESFYHPLAVDSLLTEPYTAGGNSPFRRWISEEEIKFKILAPLLSGYDGVYIYEDSFLANIFYNPDYGNPNNAPFALPSKGQKTRNYWFFENYAERGITEYDINSSSNPDIIFIDDNLSRYNWATSAIAKARAIFSSYQKDSTLKFLTFNKIGGGIDEREVILLGLYQGTNMDILAYYPFQDTTDSTNITFTINGQTYNKILDPRKCEVFHFTGNFSTLEPKNVKAQYYNIDLQLIKVTADPNYHNYN